MKNEAQKHFKDLRDRICSRFEELENQAPETLYGQSIGKFEKTPWTRPEGGGGEMSMLRGRLFEKVGVHISTVYGKFSSEFKNSIPHTDEEGNFFATGISLIAHLNNPHIPAVHMNLRFIETTKQWFGGGADLTPLLDKYRNDTYPDSIAFHEGLKTACDAHNETYYEKYKAWCDDYFYLPHRNEPRGVGGIFFDQLNSGNIEKDFEFVQSIGESFLITYPKIVLEHLAQTWTEQERDDQLIKRGRYVEFNLLYDRGTLFGLKTGGNIQAILSSMPPTVKWP